MISYLDTTFCASPHCRDRCERKFTKADAEGAKRWWAGREGDPPIAFSFFCDQGDDLSDWADVARRKACLDEIPSPSDPRLKNEVA